MPAAHYLAYYELHEIPWKIDEAIKLEARDLGIQLQVGRGPYTIPRMASPTVVTRAGGARIETVNENLVLEGGTYFGIAIPVTTEWRENQSLPQTEWDRLSQLADDAACTVGLCLNQRRGTKKVAEYIHESEGKPRRMEFRWQMFAGARASVSKRSSAAIRRALGNALDEGASPQTLVALRWYEQSKNATIGVDRFLALWIALEALMGRTRNHAELVKKTSQYLTRKEFRLSSDPGVVSRSLGLDHMREVRNEIIHEGRRLIPWPIADDPSKRDWPQILDDIVGEILRFRMKATLARTLNKHVIVISE